MKQNTIFASFLTALLAVGCAQSPLDTQMEQNNRGQLTAIEAGIESIAPVKSHLDGLEVLWSDNDKMKVFAGNEGAEFTFKSLNAEGKGIFEGTLSQAEKYYALYPYSATAAIDASGKISTTLPDVQAAVAGTFAENTNLAVAVSGTPSFGMKNACALVKFDIVRTDVLSVALKGNAEESLAGDITLVLDAEGIPANTVINGKKIVTLKGEKALTPGAYYMAVLPQNLSKGITLTYKFADNTSKTVRSKAAVELSRSTILNIGNPILNEVSVDRKAFSADVEGGDYIINVTSAGEWKAESDQPWCKIVNGTATGNGQFTISIERSTDYQYRTAEVSVTSGNARQVIHVEHVGTKIGNLVWANANVNEPDTFCDNREGRGKLYQWNSKRCYESGSRDNYLEPVKLPADYEDPAAVEKMKGLEWKEENNPCPDGWRVPTIDELRGLIDAGKGYNDKHELVWNVANNCWYDYDKVNGMAVAGAYVGLPLNELKKCTMDNMSGVIFLPQAGTIYAQSGQTDYWSIRLWSSSNYGEDNKDVKYSVNIATYGVDSQYWTLVKESASVRCVKK